MEPMRTTRNRRIIANSAIVLVAIVLFVATRQPESFLAVILPGAALNWIISREGRLACEGYGFPNVGWLTKGTLLMFPICSVVIVVYWIPRYATKLHGWALYGGISFSFGLLLVKLYERYLLARKRALVSKPVNIQ